MSNKTEVLSFDELARFHGLSLMKWDEDNYASENTELAKDFFEAGQQSRQDEADELQKNFNNALKTIGIQEQFLDDTDGTIKIITSQVDELQNRIDELKMANHNLSVMTAEAEAYSEYWKYERDKLQKKIDLVLDCIEPSDEISHKEYRELYKILKGDSHES